MKKDLNIGKISVVLGPVVDVKFETKLPKVFEKGVVSKCDMIASRGLYGGAADGFIGL